MEVDNIDSLVAQAEYFKRYHRGLLAKYKRPSFWASVKEFYKYQLGG